MNRDPSSTGRLRGGRRDTASIVNAAGVTNSQAGGGSSSSGQQGQGQAMVNGPEGVGALVVSTPDSEVQEGQCWG